MEVIIAKDYDEMSNIAAEIVGNVVKAKPDARLGFATGSSPVGLYKRLIEKCAERELDFSKVDTVNLDEYVGLAPDHAQSYRRFMEENLFNHINIDPENIYVAKGVGDTEKNIEEFRAVLAKKPIDIQVLGIGVDGHIGFNEPGEVLYDHAHKEVLDESTLDANMRFFSRRSDVPREALTMGMGDIMRARKLIMVVNGDKENAAKELLMDDMIHTGNPATFIKMHPDAIVVIEKVLADRIGFKGDEKALQQR